MDGYFVCPYACMRAWPWMCTQEHPFQCTKCASKRRKQLPQKTHYQVTIRSLSARQIAGSFGNLTNRTWPGHGLGPFSTDQLHLDILTSCDWAAQVMSSKQEGCQISLDERKRQKSQEMKYNFVAVRGTETKPCPGLSWSPCTKTGCESNDFVFQAMSP